MFQHHRKHMLMAAVGALLSAGAAAVATAYPDDGKLRVRNIDSEQECTFDDRAQLDAFLANVEFPDAWQLQGKPAELEQLDTSTATAKHVEVNLNELHAQLAADKAAASSEPAAPAADPAPAATTETPAAAAPAAPKARRTTTKA